MNVCLSFEIYILQMNSKYISVNSWTLGICCSHEGLALMKEISAFIEETQESYCAPSAT